MPWSTINQALRFAWLTYWECLDIDPVRASHIKKTIHVLTRGLKT